MKKKLDEATLVEIINKDREFQEETLRISQERTLARTEIITGYGITIQNFYIRKKKYEKAMLRNFSKAI